MFKIKSTQFFQQFYQNFSSRIMKLKGAELQRYFSEETYFGQTYKAFRRGVCGQSTQCLFEIFTDPFIQFTNPSQVCVHLQIPAFSKMIGPNTY